jgi:hypothetical protein
MAQLARPTAAAAPAAGTASRDGPAQALPIGKVQPRDRVAVTGVITVATPMSISGFPACRCTLADETGDLDLIFLGRVVVSGLEPGRHCSAEGRATERHGRTVIWNPRYLLGTSQPGAEHDEAHSGSSAGRPSGPFTAPDLGSTGSG